MKHYINAIKNFTNFNGRARRSEFWYFFLFNIIFAVATMILDNIFGTTFKMDLPGGEPLTLPYGYLYMAYGLFIFLPSLALWTRRLHDVGKSGWFLLIGLIPLIGAIWLLVLALTDSQPGDNKYGPNPKGIGFNI